MCYGLTSWQLNAGDHWEENAFTKGSCIYRLIHNNALSVSSEVKNTPFGTCYYNLSATLHNFILIMKTAEFISLIYRISVIICIWRQAWMIQGIAIIFVKYGKNIYLRNHMIIVCSHTQTCHIHTKMNFLQEQ